MAKFRRNHQRTDRSGFSSLLIRVLLFFALAALGFVYLYKMLNNSGENNSQNNYNEESYEPQDVGKEDRSFIPNNSSGQIIHHDYYSLSYIEEFEQAEWVAYKLTAASIKAPNVKRNKRFTEDYEVSTKSARHKDYSHSGYTRGHMAPAGDMAFNQTAMKQSFFMSNMSPQIRAFNGGVWRELEETVRDWAMDNNEVYVVSGPIFDKAPNEFIGQNRVAVPDQFFKVILDIEGSEKKAIGFIIPHKKSSKSLDTYAVTIDAIEKRTGLDLFANLLDGNEESLESKINIRNWAFDKKRYKQRVNNWNNN